MLCLLLVCHTLLIEICHTSCGTIRVIIRDDYLQKARAEVDKLEKQLAIAKRQLEEETLARVDVENRLQTVKEQLQLNAQIHEQVSWYA